MPQCCSVLQCVAVCCSVFQCVAVCCTSALPPLARMIIYFAFRILTCPLPPLQNLACGACCLISHGLACGAFRFIKNLQKYAAYFLKKTSIFFSQKIFFSIVVGCIRFPAAYSVYQIIGGENDSKSNIE